DFWATLLVSAFELAMDEDGDPDGTPLVPWTTVGIEVPAMGATWGTFNRSAVFLEPLRDWGSSSDTDEAHTVVHELGHAGGRNGHTSTGIMKDGAPKAEDEFDAETIVIFRTNITW